MLDQGLHNDYIRIIYGNGIKGPCCGSLLKSLEVKSSGFGIQLKCCIARFVLGSMWLLIGLAMVL